MSKNIAFKNRDRFIELGLTIAALRKLQGMSQEQLAEKAKISRSHLSSIEAPNIIRPFSLEVLYNLADALNINAGDLLNSTLPFDKVQKNPKKR
ncbi:MAG: helix-turn-helix transcriptional regulator [Anaerostipes sp.]|nr:helix-turn-helix transcriptional regulator [Anaerostipes sp.]